MKRNKNIAIKLLFLFSIIFCLLNIYYVKYINSNNQVITHFFYIPVIIGGFIWGKKNIFVTVFLSICLISVDLLGDFSTEVLYADVIRLIMVTFVTCVFSFIEEIKNKNTLMEKIVERNPLPTFVINNEHEVVFMNKACEKLTGFEAKKIIGTKNHRFFYSNEGKDTLADLLLKKTSKKEIFRNYRKTSFSFLDEVYEADIIDEARNKKIIQVSAIPLIDENNINKYVLENIFDITEYKKYARLLKDSAEKYQSLFELYPDYLIVHKNNKIIISNDVTLKLLDTDMKDLLEKNIYDFIHPDCWEKCKKSIEELYKNKKKVNPIILKIKIKNNFIDMEVSSNLFIQNDERYIITNLKNIKSEEEILIRERTFLELFNNSYKGIVITDKSNRIDKINKSFEKMFQFNEEEVKDKYIDEIVTDDRLKAEAMMITKKTYQGETVELETKRKRKDGFYLDVKIISSAITINSVIYGSVIFYEDRSVFLQIEKEKKDLQKQIFQLEKMQSLGEMLSGFAHELNNPLTSIIGYLYLLKSFSNSVDDDDFKKYIENAYLEAERAGKITKELLSISRKNKAQYILFDINEIINSLINLKKYNLMHSGIKLESNLEKSSLILKGNKDKFQIVMLNIINNAQYQLEQRENDKIINIVSQRIDNYAFIHIIDNGGGISADNMAKVFDSFYTTKPAGQGTGLGLSVSKKIILEHGGEIRAYNNEYGGVTFEIKLPLYNEKNDCVSKEQIIDIKCEALDDKTLEEKKLLVIDDEKFILDIIKNFLEKNGLKHIDTFLNPQDALRKLSFEKYDLILSDIKMPENDGFEFYEIIKDIFPYYKDKVVFLTGDTTNEQVQKKLNDESIICINKPFKLDDLMNIIRHKLS